MKIIIRNIHAVRHLYVTAVVFNRWVATRRGPRWVFCPKFEIQFWSLSYDRCKSRTTLLIYSKETFKTFWQIIWLIFFWRYSNKLRKDWTTIDGRYKTHGKKRYTCLCTKSVILVFFCVTIKNWKKKITFNETSLRVFWAWTYLYVKNHARPAELGSFRFCLSYRESSSTVKKWFSAISNLKTSKTNRLRIEHEDAVTKLSPNGVFYCVKSVKIYCHGDFFSAPFPKLGVKRISFIHSVKQTAAVLRACRI